MVERGIDLIRRHLNFWAALLMMVMGVDWDPTVWAFFFFLALSQLCDILTKSLAPLVFTVHICTMSQLVQVRFSIYHNYKILNSMKTQIHSRYGIWLSSGQLRVALWKKRFFSVTWRGNLLPTLSRSTEFGFTYKIRRFVIIFNEQRTVRNGSYIVSSRRH